LFLERHILLAQRDFDSIMFVACLVLVLATLSGALLTYLFDRSAPLPARLAMGVCLGLALLAGAGYLFALAFGLGTTCIALSLATLLLPGLLLVNPGRRKLIAESVEPGLESAWAALRQPSRVTISYIVFYAALTILLGMMFGRAVYENSLGIFTGVTNNLGDLPFHLQVISSFTQGENFPTQDPTYAGVRFVYSFLVDFEAAMLVRCGADMFTAMWLQSMFLALALVGLVQYFTQLLTKSRLAGFIAPLLVLFSGGLGWTWIFNDLRNSEYGLLPLLGTLPRDYTIVPETIFRWGNSLTSLFVPQRSILFGMPLALVIFCQWWLALEEPAGESAASTARPRMIAAGLLAGLLPLAHAHTFLVVMGVGACLMLIFRAQWRNWLLFFEVAAVIALPQLWWLSRAAGAVDTQSYMGWHLGWDRGSTNALWFWLVNTGLFIPALLLALLWRNKNFALPRRLLWFYAPFLLCFIVPNLIKLAPWVWDNIKVLFYWYLASVPLVALLLARGLEQKSKWRWAAAGALACMLLSGVFDVLRVVTDTTAHQEFDIPGIDVAQAISQKASPHAVVLHAPTYNSPVFLTGRRSLMGHPGWIFSRGLDYTKRNDEIGRMYAGAPDAEALLRQYGVEYVLIGPLERATLRINDTFWSRYRKVAGNGSYVLLRTDVSQERAGK
jgi:hypothetical protein